MEVKGNFINYGNYVDVHDNKEVYLTVEDDVKIKKQPSRFPLCLNYHQGETILIHLKDNGFVEKSTDPMAFLWQMGCTDERPTDVKPTVWLKNKQLLREMLELWFAKMLEDQSLKKVQMEAICSQVFIDKDGEMIHLAKNKATLSADSDDLKKIFATI